MKIKEATQPPSWSTSQYRNKYEHCVIGMAVSFIILLPSTLQERKSPEWTISNRSLLATSFQLERSPLCVMSGLQALPGSWVTIKTSYCKPDGEIFQDYLFLSSSFNTLKKKKLHLLFFKSWFILKNEDTKNQGQVQLSSTTKV